MRIIMEPEWYRLSIWTVERDDSMKKMAAFLLSAALLVACAGCSESAPIEGAGGDGGGTAVVQSQTKSENETSQKEDSGLMGKTLAYRAYAYKGNDMLPIDYEFTAEKVQIFDSYQDAGIPKEEFMEQYTTDREFVLVDIRVKKTAGPSKEEISDNPDTIEYLKLANREMREASKNENPSVIAPILCYFSGHSQDRYYDYWLEPGEEKTYQVGWCLQEESKEPAVVVMTNTEGLALYLGLEAGLQGDCIELTE